jgi:hypothetical protein
MLTSAGPTTLVLNGPAPPTPAYLPLSGLLTAGDGTPSSAAVTQTFPGAMTITAMRGEAVTTTAVSGQPVPLPIEAQLFKGASGAAPVASGPPCTATPAVPPAVPIPIGSTFTFSCTGLSIPVAAGDHGYVALTLVSQGAGFFFTLNLQSSIGLKGS